MDGTRDDRSRGSSWEAAALDAMDVGVMLVVDGAVTRFNRAARDLLRVPPDRIVLAPASDDAGGLVLSGVLDEAGRPVPAEDLVTATVLRERVRVERVVQLRWSDGAARTLHVVGVPVDEGGLPGAVLTYRDVTDDVGTRHELRASEHRLQEILDAVDASVFVKDLRGRYTFVNAAFERAAGLAADEVLGRTASDLALVPDTLVAEDQDREVLATGVTRSAVLQMAGRHWLTTKSPMRNDDGHIVGVIATATDVTDQQAARDRETQLLHHVEHMDRLDSLGQLAAGVAHDFNNLLAAITLTAEMLQVQLPQGSPELESAGQIVDIARRATQLTARMLVFARNDESAVGRVDLNDAVRRAESLLERTLGAHVARTLQLCEGACVVEAEPARLEQVVLNLALNARDAMPEGGRLVIATEVLDLDEEQVEIFRTRSAGPHVVLSVSDTGAGMAEEVRRAAFDPFFTTKPTGQGTGLGLATVYGVARRAGGGAWIYSEPGLGTSVRVAFPLVDVGPPAAPAAPRPPLPAPGPGNRLVLVLEDEPSLRAVAERLLQRAGHRVLSYDEGSALLAALPELPEPPDLLLSDVVLPGMSGPEVAEQAVRLVPSLRVILMSGYTAGLVGRSAVTGEVLAKPFSSATLLAAVDRALAEDPAG